MVKPTCPSPTSKYTGLSVLIHAECEASRAFMPRRHVASEVYQKKVLQKVARFVIDIKLPLEIGDLYCFAVIISEVVITY